MDLDNLKCVALFFVCGVADQCHVKQSTRRQDTKRTNSGVRKNRAGEI